MVAIMPGRGEIDTAVTRRLDAEFVLPADTIRRCVTEVRMRARHLGIPVTAGLVEAMARERLRTILYSRPPSGGEESDHAPLAT
jgi:hypothetical protein